MNKERLQKIRASLPVGILVSCGIGLIALIGITFALVAYSDLAPTESLRANAEHQRAIVDAVTGHVSGIGEDKSAAFDVGDTVTNSTPEMGATKETAQQEIPTLSGELPHLRDAPLSSEPLVVARGAESLVKAPAPEAIEKSGDLILPRKTDQGRSPWLLYGRNFTAKANERTLALVITDAGFSNDSLKALVDMPKEVSVAVSPYAPSPNAIVETLRNAGHEAWVMLPMASDRYPQDDPGPLGLQALQPADSALGRVHQVLGSSIGAVGVVLPPDEAVAPSADVWKVVFTEINGRGLLTLSTRPDRGLDTITPDKKKQETVHRADIILDSTPATAFIRSKIAALSSQHSGSQQLVAIASARPQTLDILSDWLKTQKDFTLAPLSAMYRSEQDAAAPPSEEPKTGHH